MKLPGADGELGAELVRVVDLAKQVGIAVTKLRAAVELNVEMKSGNEPVTIADKHASDVIVRELRAAFPADPIISEEMPPAEGALASPRVWLVDPIDGTKDFIKGNDGYSVMIGLLRGGRPVLGVVHQPTLNRTYFATPDGGAHAIIDGALQPLHVSDVAEAAQVRLVASASHRSPDIDRVKSTLGINNELNVGSVGLKLCLIALGVRDLYVNPASKTKAWDTCAPEAILTAAGGRLTDLFGAQVDYSELRQPAGLVASNGRVHDEVVAKLSPLFGHLRANRP